MQGAEAEAIKAIRYNIGPGYLCESVYSIYIPDPGERAEGQKHVNTDARIQGALYCSEASWACFW